MEVEELRRDYAWEALLAEAFDGKVALALDPGCSSQPFALENVTQVLGVKSFDEDGLTEDALLRLDDGRFAYVSGFVDGGGARAVFALELSTLLDYLGPKLKAAFGL